MSREHFLKRARDTAKLMKNVDKQLFSQELKKPERFE